MIMLQTFFAFFYAFQAKKSALKGT